MSGRGYHCSTTSMLGSSTTDKSCAVPSSSQGDLKPEKAWRVTLEKEGQAPALRNKCAGYSYRISSTLPTAQTPSPET